MAISCIIQPKDKHNLLSFSDLTVVCFHNRKYWYESCLQYDTACTMYAQRTRIEWEFEWYVGNDDYK